MTGRQQEILNALIESYIKDAQPIGSKRLGELFEFGIKPAMIRHEMSELEKEGYLEQPHTSAGRVPTDKAYRLYINNLLKEERQPLSVKEREKVNSTVSAIKDLELLVRNIPRIIAELSQELSVSGIIGQDTFYTSGLARILEEPELQESSAILQLASFLDEADRGFSFAQSLNRGDGFRILIGSEIPLDGVSDFTFIMGRYNLPEGHAGFVSIIGPRRMNYHRNVALVRYIKDIMQQYF